MNELKMYCVVSREALKAMNGNRGKLGSQTGHAYLHAFWNAANRTPELADQYKNSQAAVKVTLVVDTTEELLAIAELYSDYGLTIVEDAGRTVFSEPTVTCIGIGPIDPADREEKLKSLKPLV